MRKLLCASGILAIILLGACKKSTYNPGTTATVNAAGGWWVTFTQGGVDVYGLGTFFLTTYNDAANDPDSLWVDDLTHSWGFKCKAGLNYKNLTFTATNAINDYQNDSVNIANGKVLPKAGRSKAGNPTDSIYMEATFSDDPTHSTYIISGTERTGFIEDDY